MRSQPRVTSSASALAEIVQGARASGGDRAFEDGNHLGCEVLHLAASPLLAYSRQVERYEGGIEPSGVR